MADKDNKVRENDDQTEDEERTNAILHGEVEPGTADLPEPTPRKDDPDEKK